ncbi:hypothetical protein CSC70_12355 [Pseudoxanthomonas kalamensis DSM 18571]|uniref:hypothetical protein n=1 Tax=Pseudoxanthomonas kalamensis TaxID=289483 RepID=UPI0013908ADB|nr:hypothetical protein [Pseudoxanthomonas kalamensis]KAF1708886.1 hypothetical protein CSC70_12355 [Pseudoxanthomonas kalamensis DSM 18571]
MKKSCLLFLALLAGAVHAHEDRILTLQPDGNIPEIPASFGSVFLSISGLDGSAPSVRFHAGMHVNDLPTCAARYIRSKSKSDVQITGSWHHDESSLPYYIYIQFRDPGYTQDKSFNSSVNMLFNLRTAELMEFKRFEASRSGKSGRSFDIKLPENCKIQEHSP